MRGKKEKKFLPTLSQVQEAADLLPDPEKYQEDSYETGTESWKDKYSITFQKVRFLNRNGKKIYRWTYEGRIMVRPKEES